MPTPVDGSRRLYLHIGLPKSGTTFLQALLASNRDRLRSAGFLYPLPHREAMFHAAVEVRGSHGVWGLDPERTAGTWKALCDRARGFDGTSVISHEILSAATAEQVTRAAEELHGLDVHVVVTARDLGRQVTAHWQETVKNGGKETFAAFERKLVSDIEEKSWHNGFWRSQHLPAVLERWSAVVPAEQVHLVVGPRPGADRMELWRRFAAVLGLDPELVSTEAVRASNESLGTTQVALLRDVNEALEGRIVQPTYSRVVKRYFAQRVLSGQRSRRPTVPGEMHDLLLDLSRQWCDDIRGAGYAVHGDLDDLLPLPPEQDAPAPDDVAVQDRYDAAVGAVAELLTEVARLRQEGSGRGRAGPVQARPLVRRVLDRLR